MAVANSTMLALGTTVIDFKLRDVSGMWVSLSDFRGCKGLLVMFLSNHCPYVRHVRVEIVAVARKYGEMGIASVAIMPNDVERYPDDGPEMMKSESRNWGFTFPYLLDETQEVAKAYRAACTPEFYLFDDRKKLVYRGRLDDSRPDNSQPVTGKDLRAALDALIGGKEISPAQLPSVGCSIKWRPGNEPAYLFSGGEPVLE